MANSIKKFSLTPRESAEKALIVDSIRTTPRGPWVNGKKTGAPESRSTTVRDHKKK